MFYGIFVWFTESIKCTVTVFTYSCLNSKFHHKVLLAKILPHLWRLEKLSLSTSVPLDAKYCFRVRSIALPSGVISQILLSKFLSFRSIPHIFHTIIKSVTRYTIVWKVSLNTIMATVDDHKECRIFLTGGLMSNPLNFHSRAQKSALSILSFLLSAMSLVSFVLKYTMYKKYIIL